MNFLIYRFVNREVVLKARRHPRGVSKRLNSRYRRSKGSNSSWRGKDSYFKNRTSWVHNSYTLLLYIVLIHLIFNALNMWLNFSGGREGVFSYQSSCCARYNDRK